MMYCHVCMVWSAILRYVMKYAGGACSEAVVKLIGEKFNKLNI